MKLLSLVTWGWGRDHAGHEEEGEEVPMTQDVDTRISSLLDQLENPNLSTQDRAELERKLAVLKDQQE